MSNPNEEQTSPRITTATWGRIAGVAAFVVLGTFAVIYSMKESQGLQANDDQSGTPAADAESDPSIVPLVPPQTGAESSTPSQDKPRQSFAGNPAPAFDGLPGNNASTNPGNSFLPPGNLARQSSTTSPGREPGPPLNRYASTKPPAVMPIPETQDQTALPDSPKPFQPSPPSDNKPATTDPADLSGKSLQNSTQSPSTSPFPPISGGEFKPQPSTGESSSQPALGGLGGVEKLKEALRDDVQSQADELKSQARGAFDLAKPMQQNRLDGTLPPLSGNSIGPGANPPPAQPPASLQNPGPPPASNGLALPAPPRQDSTRSVTIEKSTELPPLRNNSSVGSGESSPADSRLIDNSSLGSNSAAGSNSTFGNNPGAGSPPQAGFGSPFRTKPPAFPPAAPAVRPQTSPPSNSLVRQPETSAPPTGIQNRGLQVPTNSSATTNNSLSIPGDRLLEGTQNASLTVEKIAPKQIQVNTPAEFYIVVRNVGRVTAENVEVIDRVPEGTQFQSAFPQVTPNNGTLIWAMGAIRPGQEKRIKLNLIPLKPGEIGSVARVRFATPASMRTLVTQPVLGIRHSIQPKIMIGDNAVLDIVVENKGDGPAKNVVIQEDVPAQLEYQEGFRELEYEIGTLAPGQSKRVRLSLRAARIGRGQNTLIATASGNLQASHKAGFEVISPQLVATAEGPSRKFLRRAATHRFSVENKGTATATNVDLIARLPSGLQFVSANNQGKYDRNTNSVYWSLAELTPTVLATVELQTLPVETGQLPIRFATRADLGQSSEIQKDLLVEHLVDVFFDIDDVVDPVEIGNGTSYRIKVVNQGTRPATNIRLQVVFPNGIRPTSVDGNLPHQVQANRILFQPINSMNPGDEIKLVVNGEGVAAGDHRVVVTLQADGRQTDVSKEESTRVYNDR